MKSSMQILGVSVLLLVATSASAESAAGYGKGYISRAYPGVGVPLLDSFYLRYVDTDHHLQSLSVRPQSNRTIEIALGDHNNDDEYFYTVEHKRRTTSGIVSGSFTDFCTGTCGYPLTPPGPGYTFALRGFRFQFRGGDHQIDQIGILRTSVGVQTYFNDDDNDDPYMVDIQYAWLPPLVVQRTGQLRGTAAGGAKRTLAGAGNAIITGFLVDYVGDVDHEYEHFGVTTNSQDVQIFFGDKNDDDTFDYRVNYAILNAGFASDSDGVDADELEVIDGEPSDEAAPSE